MVEVFGLVRDVLADDGTLWLNLGDSYAGSGRGGYSGGAGTLQGSIEGQDQSRVARGSQKHAGFHETARQGGAVGRRWVAPPTGLKKKDLIGIPWMVAFALRESGWWLRQDIIWHKPNPMPESITDRCTKAHEYIFLLSKSESYYSDFDAIKEPSVTGDPRRPYAPGQVDARGNGHARGGGTLRKSVKRGGFAGKTNAMPGREAFRAISEFRNKRSVWSVSTKPYSEAHFATYPPELIEPCILAGSRPGDIVLDPFFGSGTTGQVAEKLGRQYIGIELNPEYVKLAAKRTAQQGMQL